MAPSTPAESSPGASSTSKLATTPTTPLNQLIPQPISPPPAPNNRIRAQRTEPRDHPPFEHLHNSHRASFRFAIAADTPTPAAGLGTHYRCDSEATTVIAPASPNSISAHSSPSDSHMDLDAPPPTVRKKTVPVSADFARNYIGGYLARAETDPTRRSNSLLTPTGVVARGPASGDLVLHGLRRVHAGLQGEQMAADAHAQLSGAAHSYEEPRGEPAAITPKKRATSPKDVNDGWEDKEAWEKSQEVEVGDVGPGGPAVADSAAASEAEKVKKVEEPEDKAAKRARKAERERKRKEKGEKKSRSS